MFARAGIFHGAPEHLDDAIRLIHQEARSVRRRPARRGVLAAIAGGAGALALLFVSTTSPVAAATAGTESSPSLLAVVDDEYSSGVDLAGGE